MSLYGPLITPLDVEAAIKSTLQAYINQYLGEIELRREDWALGEIERPKAWEVVSDVEKIQDWPARHLPAVVVESAAEAIDPKYGDDGDVDAQMAFTVTVLDRGANRDRERTRASVILTATAIRWILLHQGDLGGIADATIPGLVRFDTVKPTKPTSLTGAQMVVTVVVSGIANRYVGPQAPNPPEDPPPSTSPDDPLHTSTRITVTEE